MSEWAGFVISILATPYILISDFFQARKDRIWLERFRASQPWNDGTD